MENLKISKEDNWILDEYNVRYEKSNGYYRAYKDGNYYYLHRLIMDAGENEIVDHINRVKTDNRRCNLRLVDKRLNNYNRNVKSKYGRGIYYDKHGDRFRACISLNNKTLKLGSFKSVDEAKKAYNKKAKEIYGGDAYIHSITK